MQSRGSKAWTYLGYPAVYKLRKALKQQGIRYDVPGPGDVHGSPSCTPWQILKGVIWASNRLKGQFELSVHLHWLPGHRHDVYPHQLVDHLSVDAWTEPQHC